MFSFPALIRRVCDPNSRAERRGGRPARCAAGGLIAILLALSGPVAGAEPAERFLGELKARGYFELALIYLDRLEKTGTADEAFQQSIAYEQGEVLIQAALRQRTPSRKQAELDRAQQQFQKFSREHGDHPLSLSAHGRLGDIAMERARLLVSQSNQTSTVPEKRDALIAEARGLFDDAVKISDDYRSKLRKRLEQIPKALSLDRDGAQIKERNLYRSQYVQAQFVSAMVRYEKAMTYGTDTAKRKKLLQQSEAAFKVVAEKYRRRLAGLSAVLFQGRCRQLAGDPRGALAFYEDLLTLPDNEPLLRPLKTKALRDAMKCWIDPEVSQYEAARQRAEAWLQQERRSDRGEEDWLMIKLRLAETYHQMAENGATGREKSELTRSARRLAIDVAKYRSAARAPAQSLLAQLGHITQPVAQTQPVATFDEAMVAARDALSRRQVASQTVALLRQRLPRAENEANRKEISLHLEESLAQLDQSEQRAMDILRRAQDLVTDETPIQQVNQARYYLCTLYYYRGDYYAAAVLADFLSARFPSTEDGRRAASVSLASLVRLYGDGTSAWAPAMHERITRTAERIAQQWKGQPEADDALVTLVTIAARAGNAPAAFEYLHEMSDDSPKRAAAELAAGQALWNLANRGIQGDDQANSPEKRQARAVETMVEGLKRSAGQEPTPATLACGLIVVQYLMNHDQARQAVEHLEDPDLGPKTLVDQDHPSTRSPNVRQRIYLLSMMAYIGALSESDSAADLIDKALATLEHIQNSAQGDAASQRRLSSTYVTLARSLQQQIQSAPVPRQAALIEAFSQILGRAVSTTNELSVLSWAADSYVKLGEAAKAVGRNDDAAAQPYFSKAVSTYKDLLKRSDAGDFTMNAQERMLLETRLAMALRSQEKFAEAVDRFAAILKLQPSQVYVQMEAARTLQRWGDHGNHEAYHLAIRGDRTDKKTNRNTIWGYGRIAKLVAAKQNLRKLFHEARYGVAECRFQFALQLASSERMKVLRQAEQDIVMTARFYPKLGGEKAKERYNRLLKEIQTTMGKRPTGLSS